MATIENTYTGDGSTTNFSFTFEYLEQSDVKASLGGTATTAFTFANATTLSFTTAPANGVAVRNFRDTNVDTLKATFFLVQLLRLKTSTITLTKPSSLPRI